MAAHSGFRSSGPDQRNRTPSPSPAAAGRALPRRQKLPSSFQASLGTLRPLLAVLLLASIPPRPQHWPVLGAAAQSSPAISDCTGLYNTIQQANKGAYSSLTIAAGVTIQLRDCEASVPGFVGLPGLLGNVSIIGQGTTAPTISGSKKYSIFIFGPPAGSTLFATITNLNLVNGVGVFYSQPGSYGQPLYGGCLRLLTNASAALTGVNFVGCTASVGGALYLGQGALTVASCTFYNNSATGGAGGDALGGAIFTQSPGQNGPSSSLTISSSNFTANSAAQSSNAGAQGGAIFSQVPTVLTSTSFNSNSAKAQYNYAQGGAIGGYLLTLSMTSCAFSDNAVVTASAAALGGALVCSRIDATSSSFTRNSVQTTSYAFGGAVFVDGSLPGSPQNFLQCSFEGNSATGLATSTGSQSRGGAVFLQPAGDATVTGSVFNSNLAYSYGDLALGGALFLQGKSLYLSTSNFVNNSAVSTGAAGNGAWGGALYASHVVATSCTFSDCLAQATGTSYQFVLYAFGGAVFVDTSLPSLQTSFTSCAFYRNAALGYSTVQAAGGALFMDAGQGEVLVLLSSKFAENKAQGVSARGGAVFSYWVLTATSCAFESNAAVALGVPGSSSYGVAAGGGVHSDKYYSLDAQGNTLNVTLTDCSFAGNSVAGVIDGTSGGAVWAATVIYDTRNTFVENSVSMGAILPQKPSSVCGGAVCNPAYNGQTISLNSSYADNTVNCFSGDANGGAICAPGAVNVSGGSFTRNSATSQCAGGCNGDSNAGGGAVFSFTGVAASSTVFVNNSHVSALTGTSNGGAVFCQIWSSAPRFFSLNACVFQGNWVQSAMPARGGAVHVHMPQGVTGAISRVVFLQNSASGAEASGGAVHVNDGPVAVTSSNFSLNSAWSTSADAWGGALDAHLISNGGGISVFSTTFTSNSAASVLGSARGGAVAFGLNSQGALQLAKSKFMTNSARAGKSAFGGALYVDRGSSALASTVSECSFDGSEARGNGSALGGAVFFSIYSKNAFCRSSSFGLTMPNVVTMNGSRRNDISGSGATVKFCPQVPLEVDASTFQDFVPVVACDSCTCAANYSPCDPKATCTMLPIPSTSSTVPVCACKLGTRGNGFTCGSILVCSAL